MTRAAQALLRSWLARAQPSVRFLVARLSDAGERALGHTLALFSVARRRELARRERERGRQAGRWFTPAEAALVTALAALIVPSDEGGPGANEADLVRSLDRTVATSPAQQELYALGLLAFDEWARKIRGMTFVQLRPAEQLSFLQMLDEMHNRRSTRGPLASRLARKATVIYERWKYPSVELLRQLRRDALGAFYTSPVCWTWLAYDGPPMPHGYQDLRDRGASLT